MTNAHHLLAVTELDTDGPDVMILSVAIVAPDDLVFDLGIVIQRPAGEWIVTAFTSAL